MNMREIANSERVWIVKKGHAMSGVPVVCTEKHKLLLRIIGKSFVHDLGVHVPDKMFDNVFLERREAVNHKKKARKIHDQTSDK